MPDGAVNPGFKQDTYSLAGKDQRGQSSAFSRVTRSAKLDLMPDLGDMLVLKIDPYYEPSKLWNSPLGDTLRFTFLDLDAGIQESAAVNYADIEVLGRTEAFKNYTGTGNREIPLTFQFRAQGLASGTLAEILDREVVQPAKFLDALKFPLIGSDKISHAPPPCLLVIGSLLVIRVIATDVQLTWVPPFDVDTMLPYGADVAVTFTAVHRGMENYNFSGPYRFQNDKLILDAASISRPVDLNTTSSDNGVGFA